MDNFIGFDNLHKIKEIIEAEEKILIVSGKTSFEISGAKSIISSLLKKNPIIIFNEFSPNPDLEDIKIGINLYKKFKPDKIIAIGGGSAIDTAKIISFFGNNNFSIQEYFDNSLKCSKNCSNNLIAIPTTAGSGSEATHFAVFYINHKKYSLACKSIKPSFIIADAKLTMTLPPEITASSGIDALSQAIESYWSINSTKESKKYSKESINLVFNNLEKAVNAPNKESRLNMLKAAYLAGKAIDITKTTACHALSYSFTSHFGINHGHAAGLTLGEVYLLNSQVNESNINDKRGVDFVLNSMKELNEIFQVKNSLQAKNKINNLMKNINLETNIINLGINKKNYHLITDNINKERFLNNPRVLSRENVQNILEKIL